LDGSVLDRSESPPVLAEGKWHASNVRKRNKRKVNRLSESKRKSMNGPWRASCEIAAVDGGSGRSEVSEGPFVDVRNDVHSEAVGSFRQGFFVGCDQSVQQELRDSRARMLIAKNNREEMQHKKKMGDIATAESVVADLVRVTKLAAQLRSQTKDQKIGGWAETVAESLSKSVAESASSVSSSLPSLESVGYGQSSLDNTKVNSVRYSQYQRDLKYVHDSFSDMDSYAEEDYVLAVAEVKRQFSDVAFTKEELERKQLVAGLSSSMAEEGISFYKIEEVFSKVGIALYD